jgi:outer membrane protein assembly factor BamB
MRTFLLTLSLLAPLSVARADWPLFRGPNGNGIASALLLPGKIDTNSIAWAADLPGRGLSSPIIIGERVFVTCASGPKQDRLHVICFNAKDGSKLWERQFWATGRTMCHEKTCVAAPTPASDGERLFVIFSSNDLVCLDLDGNLLWLRGLTRDYPNASNSLGMSSSLTVADGTVIAMVENDDDSFTAGLDAKTGVNRWKLQRPKAANWTSPVLFKAPGSSTQRAAGFQPAESALVTPAQKTSRTGGSPASFRQQDAGGTFHVLLQSSKGLVAVEPATGRIVWQYTDGASTIPSATVSDGVIYVPSHGITALKPEPEGQSPRQLWRSGQLRPATSSPVVANQRVFTLNDAGVLTCGEAAEGKRLWQLRLKGPFSATPVGAGNLLYCVNEKGVLQVVDIAAPEGGIVSELALGKTILSTPSIANGAIYVRSDGKLWKLGKS